MATGAAGDAIAVNMVKPPVSLVACSLSAWNNEGAREFTLIALKQWWSSAATFGLRCALHTVLQYYSIYVAPQRVIWRSHLSNVPLSVRTIITTITVVPYWFCYCFQQWDETHVDRRWFRVCCNIITLLCSLGVCKSIYIARFWRSSTSLKSERSKNLLSLRILWFIAALQ